MSRHLLITEDDASLRQMLAWDFADLGYRVTEAGCCREALALTAGLHLDVALLDYNLPDGLGTDMIPLLIRRFPALPIIVCSGREPAWCCTELERILARGSCRFVCKPAPASQLHRLFQHMLAQAPVY